MRTLITPVTSVVVTRLVFTTICISFLPKDFIMTEFRNLTKHSYYFPKIIFSIERKLLPKFLMADEEEGFLLRTQ